MKLLTPFLALSLAACGEQTVKVVNTAPNVSILSPSDNAEFIIGTAVVFGAVVDDSQQAPETLTLGWISDRDGDLDATAASGSGEVNFSTVNLTLGTHLIRLRAIDDNAEVGEDQVIISMVEAPPETNDVDDKTGVTFCAAGGSVSGGGMSGSFCTGPIDIAAGASSSGSGKTWYPGPTVKVSP